MTDVEKIIEGLNETISYFQAHSGNTPERCAQHLRDAVAFLKEQEAVEPTVSGAEEYDGHCSWWYQCGKCKTPIDHGDRFCRWCGRPVKWNA